MHFTRCPPVYNHSQCAYAQEGKTSLVLAMESATGNRGVKGHLDAAEALIAPTASAGALKKVGGRGQGGEGSGCTREGNECMWEGLGG